MIAEKILSHEDVVALLLPFILSSAVAAVAAVRCGLAAGVALSALGAAAIGLGFHAAGNVPLPAVLLLILNGVSIALLAKVGMRPAIAAAEAQAQAEPPAPAPAAEKDNAGTLALIQNYEEIEALSKERTLFMLKRSKQLREALKQQERLNDLQRSFVVMLSHEFRTPLAIMDSSAQKIKSRHAAMAPEEIVQRTDTIRGAIRRLTDLMEKILASAKYEDGNLPLTFQRCDLKAILASCIASVADTQSHHRIDAALGDLPEVLGDKEALNQLFDNLLRNAVKYSPNADRVDVRARADGESITVEVEDYGSGIDEDDLPKLFERFFRARNSEGIEGTGVGLSVVKLITDQHGGTVTVASRKGEGTIFTVQLPAAQAASRDLPRAVGE
jgi:signal transduction histidine kinase